jgi:hypothetical protein
MSRAFKLREQPGVAEIEALMTAIALHPNPAWAKENDDLPSVIEATALKLFGVTDASSEWVELENDADVDCWNAFYDVVEGGSSSDLIAALSALGWDVTDPAGYLLPYAKGFAFPILCAVKGWAGHLPGNPSDEAVKADADAWGSDLAKEAERFRRGSHKR